MNSLVIVPIRTCLALPNRHRMPVGGEPMSVPILKALLATKDYSNVVVTSEVEDARHLALDLGAKSCDIPLGLSGEVALSSIVAYTLTKLGFTGDAVFVVNEAAPFVTADDVSTVGKHLQDGKFQSVVTVTETRPTVMKALRKGKRGFWHEDEAKRAVFVSNEMVRAVSLPYFFETHRVIGAKGGIVLVPPERAVVVKDAWDYMKAKGMYDELRNIGSRKAEVR